ncbi:MAG: hypothetical protein ACOYT7_00685 [Patescibacteria group bacterium]
MKIPLKVFLLIIAGTTIWSLTMVKSGLVYSSGMGFWGPNGHDGVWHVALIESLSRGSLEMPTFAGEALKNYHIGFDLVLAIVHKLTQIPTVTLYFQIVPPILAFLVGYLTYEFVSTWRKDKKEAFWAAFFVYFAGSFGWVLSLIRGGGLGGESTFWAQQAISTLVNPPFALSLVLMLLGLISLLKKKWLLAVVSFGALIQVKAYAGILSLIGLFVAGIFEYLKEKKLSLLKVFAGASLVSILLTLPFIASLSLLVIRPFWFLETMMGFGDRVGWQKFYSAMTNYVLAGSWLKAFLAYSAAFLIFLVGNLGTRIVSLAFMRKSLRKLSWTMIFIFSVILAGTLLPMFLLQKGTAWNTIQFFYYSLFFLGILAGISLATYKKGIIVVVILLTIPTTIGTLRHYLPARPPAKISLGELEALAFLSEQPQGVVLTYPFDRAAAKAAAVKPPRSLYLYESTAYVAAFGKKTVFLEDEVNLDIMGYQWPDRREEIENFLDSLDHQKGWSFLRESNITYVYWLKGQGARLGEGQLGITRIFENSEVDIYRVD